MSLLLAGIKTHFTGAAALSSVGAPYFAAAPEKLSPPYARVSEITSIKPLQTLDAKYVERKLIQITIWHTALETLITLQEAVKTRFDRQTFAISGATLIGCQLSNDFIADGGPAYLTGEQVYAGVTEWLMQVDRSR
jgi:hypothetical protein